MSRNPFAPVLNSVCRALGLDPSDRSADTLLLERFVRTKDEEAFAALVERHAALVWGVCRRVAGDAHTAEDAFQATWLVLARRAGSLREGGALSGWLFRVAYRLALAARPGPAAPLEDAPTASAGPEAETALRETRALIDDEVNRLPEKYRVPVVLCFYEGRTHAEAAAELGWPIGTVAGRVARAKDLLRARLERRGVGLPTLPLVAAGAYPTVVAKASAGSAALAAKLLVTGLRGRVLAWAAVLALPLAIVLTILAVQPPKPETQPQTVPRTVSRPQAAPPEPEAEVRPPRKEPLIIQANRFGIHSVAFSPDGKLLATTGNEELVKLWDARTGKELATLRGHTKFANTLAFSPDGKTLASGGNDKTIRLWDLATHQEIATLDGPAVVRLVVFNPDGKTLVAGYEGRSPLVWDIQKRLDVADLAGGCPAAFSPDGTLQADSNCLWEVATGKLLARLAGGGTTRFSPDGKRLVVGRKIVDLATGSEVTLFAPTDGFGRVEFSPDGKTLVATWYKQVRSFSTISGRELASFPGLAFNPQREPLSVALSPDGKTLASGYNDGTVRVVDVSALLVKAGDEEGPRRERTTLPWQDPTSIAISPDGKVLAAGTASALRRWDLARNVELPPLAERDLFPRRVAFQGRRNGTLVAATVEDATIKLWDATSEKLQLKATLKGHTYRTDTVAFSPDGTTLASGGRHDKLVRLWDVTTGKELVTFGEHPANVDALAFSSDGRTVAAGNNDEIKLWDVRTGKVLTTLRGRRWEAPMTFSPDGKRLAVGGEKSVKLWDLATGKESYLPSLHIGDVWAVRFSPDSKTLASAGEDRTIVLYDVKTSTVRDLFAGHQKRVSSVLFSPDGRTLASCGESIKLWDTGDRSR